MSGSRILNEKTIMHYISNNIPEKTGFLLKKRSENKRAFKKRYFILCGNILSYSEHKNDKDPLGVIFLEGHSVELVDDNIFAIRFNSTAEAERNYILKAGTDSEAESWMQALTHCGSEFLMLSVEELEDHVRAVTPSDGEKITFKASPVSSLVQRNPFNVQPFGGKLTTVPGAGPERIARLMQLFNSSWDDLQSHTKGYLDWAVATKSK